MKTLMLLLLCAGFLQAAETAPIRPAKGVMTLDFAFQQLLQLEAASGGTISLRHWFNEKSALSAGLSVSRRFQDGEYYVRQVQEDTTITDQEDRTDNSWSVELEVLLQRVVKGKNPVLLLGAGPVMGLGKNDNSFSIGGRSRSGYDEYNYRWIGLQGLVSAEWFFGRAFSLSASYRPNLVYRKGDSDKQSTQLDGTDYTYRNEYSRWELDEGRVRLGLSIWFD